MSGAGRRAQMSSDPIPVVGIGASAGGLDALQLLLPALPVDCGIAFVIVQHLSPDHQSNLPAILSRLTKLQVAPITASTRLLADHVYVIPPHAMLQIEGNTLQLSPPQGDHGMRHVVDSFFVSL